MRNANSTVQDVNSLYRIYFLWDDNFHHIYPTPPLGQDMTQGQFFKQSLTGLNSEFSFS